MVSRFVLNTYNSLDFPLSTLKVKNSITNHYILYICTNNYSVDLNHY